MSPKIPNPLRLEWYQHPSLILQLSGLSTARDDLREKNLFEHEEIRPADALAEAPEEAIRARMPDGTAYLSVARTVERPAWGPARPHQIAAVELGCEAVHAGELAFARGLDLDSEDAAVPIGTTCRLCERRDCPQRALPPVGSAMVIDETRRLSGVATAPPGAAPPD